MIRLVCPDCGGRDFNDKGVCQVDEVTQRWVVTTAFGELRCPECDSRPIETPSPLTFLPAPVHVMAPVLAVGDGLAYLDFLTNAFGAIEPDESSPHGMRYLTVAGMDVYLAQCSPGTVAIRVLDVGQAHAHAVSCGATSDVAPAVSHGMVSTARIIDPAGNKWIFIKA